MDSRIVIVFHLLSLFILMFKLSHIWLVGPSLSWLLYSFEMSLLVFEDFLAFRHHKIIQDHLYFPCQSLGTIHFSRSSRYFYWRIIFGSQVLMAVGWGCSQTLSMDKSRRYRFEHTHTHVHAHRVTYTYIHTVMSIFIPKLPILIHRLIYTNTSNFDLLPHDSL